MNIYAVENRKNFYIKPMFNGILIKGGTNLCYCGVPHTNLKNVTLKRC